MGLIRIGNAPCSWGSLEFDGFEGEPIGYQQMFDLHPSSNGGLALALADEEC